MARLSDKEINEIRSKANIVEVIARYIPLTKKGKSHVCTCPFHDDHDPSMSISEDKQIYKCFVCGAGGNVFTFIQKFEQISFIEAVCKVADFVGIQIDHSFSLPEKKIDPHKEALYKVCKDMIEFTHYQLQTIEAKPIKDYLIKRGVHEDIMQRFEIGYNPKKDSVYQFLHAKKHLDEHILEAGVARMSSIGMKDVFTHRITIPIHDAQGNPVGFTARRIEDNEEAKYINTQDTLIYHKGQLIFNYHRAKTVAKKENRIYIVEGAMDVLAFEKVGLSNSVAMLGTACTKEQLMLLKQLSIPIVLCYDGDNAGRNATYKFGKLASEHRIAFEVVKNTYELDPDEIIDMYGKDELRNVVNSTISWLDFLFVYLNEKYNLDNYSQRKEFALEMAQHIETLQEDFEKHSYYIRLAQLTGFDMKQEVVAPVKKESSHYTKRTFLKMPKAGQYVAEQEIISQMLNGVAASNYFKNELGFFKNDLCNKLAMYIVDYYRHHAVMDIADLLDKIKEEPVKQLLLDISNWELALEDVCMDVLEDAVRKVKACLLDDKIQSLNEKIKQMADPIAKAALADKKNKLILNQRSLLHKEGNDNEPK